MKSELEIAKNRLFEKDGLNAKNIKFFPGSKTDVSAEQLAEQVNKVLTDLEAGRFEEIPDTED